MRIAAAAIILAPAALAAAFVLTVYADTGWFLYELIRPLALAATGALVITAVLVGMTRRAVVAGSIGLIVVAGIITPLGTALLVLIGTAVNWLGRIRGRRWVPPSTWLSVVVWILLAAAIMRVGVGPGWTIGDLVSAPTASGHTIGGDPDIFMIFLDGYPRSDTLAGWGFDNRPFERQLEERGFDVAAAAHTNYPYTGQVMATMFDMRHLNLIEQQMAVDGTSSVTQQMRAVQSVLGRNPVLDELESRGYWTVHTGLTEVAGSVRNVDQDIDTGQVRLWERQVMQRTGFWDLLCNGVVMPQHRDLIRSTFDAIARVAAAKRDEPTFMLAHVMSPHTPIVFDANGNPSHFHGRTCGSEFHIDASLIGASERDYGAAMAAQVAYLNTQTIEAIDSILASSPDAAVVVFSDHGSRYSGEPSDEWFRSFLATRTPGHPNLMRDDPRPIAIFPTLFNAYFGTAYSVPADRTFTGVAGAAEPFAIQPYVNGATGNQSDP